MIGGILSIRIISISYMTFIVFIIVFICIYALHRRIGQLEDRLRNGGQLSVDKKVEIPAEVPSSASVTSNHSESNGEMSLSAQPMKPNRLVEWFKEDWLMKLGALLVLIGFSWLVNYAFVNNWIGPIGRISLGLVAGAAVLAFGSFRVQKYINQGGVFLVLGSSVVIVTLLAAREFYGFFNDATALAVMFLSTLFVSVAGMRYKNLALGLLGMALAALAPVLLVSVGDVLFMFVYLAIIVLTNIWVAIGLQRREIVLAALVIALFYSLPYLGSGLPWSLTPFASQVILYIVYGLALGFFITNTASLIHQAKGSRADLYTAVGTALWLLAWIFTEVAPEWRSLTIAAWMIIFGTGGFVIYKISSRVEPLYTYLAISVGMLAAATAAEFKTLQATGLTLAYTIETFVLVALSYVVTKSIKPSRALSYLIIGPMLLALQSVFSHRWETSIIHADFFVVLVFIVAVFGIGGFLKRYATKEDTETQQLGTGWVIVASVYLYVLIWLVLVVRGALGDLGITFALLVYAIVGLVTYLYGVGRNRHGFQVYGGVLIAFVVGRLLMVDVWGMELLGRVITFFVIGFLLISTAFMSRLKRHSSDS